MQHCMSWFKPRSVSVLLFLHQSFVSAACLPFSPCSCGQDTDHSSSSAWGWKSIPAGSSLFKSFSLRALYKCKDFLWRLHSLHTLPSAPLSLGMLTIRSKMNHSGYQEHGGEALALWPQAVVLFVSCVAGFHVWKCRTPCQHLAEPCDGACAVLLGSCWHYICPGCKDTQTYLWIPQNNDLFMYCLRNFTLNYPYKLIMCMKAKTI